ncbi:phosphohydrolase [Arthrobacter crystallopoietes BAB-32]|uniref:Phosphohydrolase n=1 Tax=Arthrobacter crystallopoietes BAB-32 TaxID=1246476 RepID=N1UY11_9MICC|nr:phosphodiesterase [Arthrobacter crystallopoietes]EMY32669.1 phosphohydrolase [Arthrobacter crystallopoietes BAB-32]
MELTPAQYPHPTHVVVHLSDTHLVAGTTLYGSVDSQARLVQILDELEGSGVRPDVIAVTGDLTDKGDPLAYEKLREMVEPVAVRLGAELIWVMGNHDKREHFRQVMLDEPPDDRPVDRTYWVGDLRVIALDTSVPGFHHGEISPKQLDWLAEELRTPAKDGTVLAIHHPPVPSIQELAVLTELRDQQELENVVKGSDVRVILAGHLHYPASGSFAGVPVSVAPATSYTQDLNTSTGVRGRDGGQGYSLVHLYEDTLLISVVTTGRYSTVGRPITGEESAKLLDAAGIYIPEPAEGNGPGPDTGAA